MIEINKMIIAHNTPDDSGPGNGGSEDSDPGSDKSGNSGTVILNATCA